MPHQVNELYKKLKEIARTPDKHSPVIAALAIPANAPREFKLKVIRWLESIIEDIDDDVDTILVCSLESMHLEPQDTFNVCFLDLGMPEIADGTNDPTLN